MAGLVEGGEVEGIGGYLHIGDDASGFVDSEGHLYPTPVELGGTLGGEGAPTAIFPLVGGENLVQGLHLWTRDYFAEGDLCCFPIIDLFKGRPQVRHNALGGNLGGELREIDHAAAYRRHTVLLQLGELGFEVACQVAHIAADKQCSVMQVVDASLAESIATELAAFSQYVISS